MEGNLAGVRFAEGGEHVHIMRICHCRNLAHETALADAGRADHADHRAVAIDCTLQQALQRRTFPTADRPDPAAAMAAELLPGHLCRQRRRGRAATAGGHAGQARLPHPDMSGTLPACASNSRLSISDKTPAVGRVPLCVLSPSCPRDPGTGAPSPEPAIMVSVPSPAASAAALAATSTAAAMSRRLLHAQAARQARIAWSSNANRRTEHRHDAVAGELVHRAAVPLHHCRAWSTSSAMISRSRSAPTAAAMSIECTTSANSTVTCLYSAGVVAVATGAPHSLQNRAISAAAQYRTTRTPRLLPSCHAASPLAFTSLSCHRWPANMCHIAAAIRPTGRRYAAPRRGVWGRIPPMCEVGACLL